MDDFREALIAGRVRVHEKRRFFAESLTSFPSAATILLVHRLPERLGNLT